ncbi:hydroxyisourate hydrolase [Mycobacterium sp. SMC-4]|uniref:hydroxyisourate hydrolase n=1 Tax=Mycobacterium sp. SMC-4 TaxID=2857059 RepID=UPI0021B461A1|nr:hydroxyisourate hydrolase [Mycobacterium sp. SMC-4]UXA17546.1 hydroxyisourate hydrolase [Mycobacterium sp. SMC-4]
MSLSTHVLDATTGRPASGVMVRLTVDGNDLAAGTTDADGRVGTLGGELTAGIYRLHFDTGGYFTRQGVRGFYPEVTITFEVTDASVHHHVPLLLSPYAYSTYRGS